MLVKEITYTDFNGEERKEKFYFNLTKAELMEMELEEEGGLGEMIKKIVETKNVPSIIKVFKKLILKAYGVKSADGKYFKKSAELADDFASTEAFSNLFMELATNADAASAFVNGIVPAGLNTTAALEEKASN